MSEVRRVLPIPEVIIEDGYVIIRVPKTPEVIEFVKEDLLPRLFQYIRYSLDRIKEGGSA